MWEWDHKFGGESGVGSWEILLMVKVSYGLAYITTPSTENGIVRTNNL